MKDCFLGILISAIICYFIFKDISDTLLYILAISPACIVFCIALNDE